MASCKAVITIFMPSWEATVVIRSSAKHLIARVPLHIFMAAISFKCSEKTDYLLPQRCSYAVVYFSTLNLAAGHMN